MAKFIVTLLCHAESAYHRPELHAREWAEWVPEFLALLDRIEKDTGVHIPITWCCAAEHSKEFIENDTVLVAQQEPDIWKRFVDRGDEVGLHIHLHREHIHDETEDKRFWCYAHEFQHLFLEEDVERMVNFGFPPPKTYTPGWQMWRKEWPEPLVQAGFEVDSTIMALPHEYMLWPWILEYAAKIDVSPYILWNHRQSAYPFRPYRTKEDDLSAEGESSLVELPVIGWIGCDCNPKWMGFENSPPFDHLVALDDLAPGGSDQIIRLAKSFEADHSQPFPSLYERWRRRKEVPVDIWPTLFHPRELQPRVRDRLDMFIRTLVEWDDVSFATAYDAACEWKRSNNTVVETKDSVEPLHPADSDADA